MIDPKASDPEQAAAFESEGLARCADGARTLGQLAIAMLLANAVVSFIVGEPQALRLLQLRVVGSVAIGAALWHLRANRRHPRLHALAIILMLGATIEALAAWTGGPQSPQHDRLNLLVLAAGFVVAWPVRWMALASGGVIAEYLLGALAGGGFFANPVLADAGSLAISGVVAVAVTSIRERRRLEALASRMAREVAARRLAEQEERYRSVVETAGSSIVVIRPDFRILEFNAEAERISGYRREDVLGRDYLRLFVPEHAWSSVTAIAQGVMRGRHSGITEGAMLCADGTKRYVRWKNACLRDADGRLVAILGAGQDITESRSSARALQRSEARLRRLVESTKAIPWEAEAETFRFTWVGPQAAALGYPLEAWTEPDFWVTHIHPDDRRRTLDTSRAASRGLSEYDLEYRMIAADGRVVWLHDLVSVERRDGVPQSLRGFLINITERKTAEHEVQRLNEGLEARVLARTAELRESEAQLRDILEASPLAGGIVEDGGRLAGNPALHALLDVPPGGDVMLGAVVHEADRAGVEAALADLRAGRADVRALEMRYVRAGGAAVWAHTSLVATGDRHGPRRVFAMIDDVTARKRKEALAEGERQALRLLAQNRGLEAALSALLACLERNDSETICSILLCDDQGCLRHGAAPRLDDEFRHAFDGIEIDAGNNGVSRVAAGGRPAVTEDLDRDPDWTPFQPLAAARGLRACAWQPILSPTGQVLGTLCIYHRRARRPTDDELALLDEAARAAAVVIERQRLDDLLEQHRAELAHVGRVSLLAELAAGMAHEIQQPLASIANYAGGCEQLLRAHTVDRAQLVDGLGRIQNTALRAGQIVRGVRELAQKQAPLREPVDVNDVARAAVQLVEGRARQNLVAIRLDLATPVPPVSADRIQLEQVVLNLLSNGIEAMPDRTGVLSVRTWVREDGAVAMAVEDTGQGIGGDVARRMFEPFFTTKPTGLGLGLSIGRTIVESHEGKMWATPATGGGAIVGFALPAATTENGHQPEPVKKAKSARAERRIAGGRRGARTLR